MVAQRLGRLMMLEPQNQFELNEAFGGEEDRFRFSFLAAFLDFFPFSRLVFSTVALVGAIREDEKRKGFEDDDD